MLLDELDEDMAVVESVLLAAESRGDLRRGLRLGLATLYTWRNLEARASGTKHLVTSDLGKTDLDALIEIRGMSEHEMVRVPPPEVSELYPGGDVYPSNHLYLGRQPFFAPDFDTSEWPSVKRDAYELLRGRSVVQMLGDAADTLRRCRRRRESSS